MQDHIEVEDDGIGQTFYGYNKIVVASLREDEIREPKDADAQTGLGVLQHTHKFTETMPRLEVSQLSTNLMASGAI